MLPVRCQVFRRQLFDRCCCGPIPRVAQPCTPRIIPRYTRWVAPLSQHIDAHMCNLLDGPGWHVAMLRSRRGPQQELLSLEVCTMGATSDAQTSRKETSPSEKTREPRRHHALKISRLAVSLRYLHLSPSQPPPYCCSLNSSACKNVCKSGLRAWCANEHSMKFSTLCWASSPEKVLPSSVSRSETSIFSRIIGSFWMKKKSTPFK